MRRNFRNIVKEEPKRAVKLLNFLSAIGAKPAFKVVSAVFANALFKLFYRNRMPAQFYPLFNSVDEFHGSVLYFMVVETIWFTNLTFLPNMGDLQRQLNNQDSKGDFF